MAQSGEHCRFITLLEEIQEQPRLWQQVLERFPKLLPQLQPFFEQSKSLTHIVGLAEGSSKNALEMAAPFLEQMVGLPIQVFEPNHFGNKNPSLDLTCHAPQDALLMVVSQSGRTGSVLQAIMENGAEENYPFILTVTNTPDSVLGKMATVTLPIEAGAECSIAATKTLTCTLLMILRFGIAWGRYLGRLTEEHEQLLLTQLGSLGGIVEQLWQGQFPESMLHFTQTVMQVNHFILLSLGSACLALPEAGLKLTETSSNIIYTDNTESFKHGPKVILAGVNGVYPNTIYLIPPSQAWADRLFKDVRSHFGLIQKEINFSGNADETPSPKKPLFEDGRVFFLRFANSPTIPPDILISLGTQPYKVLTLPPANTVLEEIFITLVFFQYLSDRLAFLRGQSPNNPALVKAVVE